MALSKDNKIGCDCANRGNDVVVSQTTSVEITKTVVGENGEVNAVTDSITAFDFYSCDEAIKRLNDYLDSELNQAEREDIIKHLKICEPCLERFDFEKNLISALRERVRKSVAPLKLKERLSALMKTGE
jgi:anti-sigma factor (TIGR02949 family)